MSGNSPENIKMRELRSAIKDSNTISKGRVNNNFNQNALEISIQIKNFGDMTESELVEIINDKTASVRDRMVARKWIEAMTGDDKAGQFLFNRFMGKVREEVTVSSALAAPKKLNIIAASIASQVSSDKDE